MDKINIIKFYQENYKDLVNNIIKENRKFFGFSETIKWSFGYDEDLSVTATCNRNTNLITINVLAFEKSLREDNLMTIEYFLLHEIRHMFQHLIIEDYKNKKEIYIPKEIVKKWIYESNHYIKSVDENNNLNAAYFCQDSEIDAYAFSYAVMKYKYGNVEFLYKPEANLDLFYEIVDDWNEAFKKWFYKG